MDFINHNKSIKVLLSISVCSILLSYSSLVSFLLYFSSAIASHSVNLFSYSFDKNYMFLLCNGLLVFIVKNSGLIGTSPPGSNNLNSDQHDGKITGDVVAVESAETRAPKSKEAQVINVQVEQELEEKERVLITEEEEEEEVECRDGFVSVEDHDEFEGEEIGYLSTEELNKKCDDFIRRMKEGIKLEVQQSMIMVQCHRSLDQK